MPINLYLLFSKTEKKHTEIIHVYLWPSAHYHVPVPVVHCSA